MSFLFVFLCSKRNAGQKNSWVLSVCSHWTLLSNKAQKEQTNCSTSKGKVCALNVLLKCPPSPMLWRTTLPIRSCYLQTSSSLVSDKIWIKRIGRQRIFLLAGFSQQESVLEAEVQTLGGYLAIQYHLLAPDTILLRSRSSQGLQPRSRNIHFGGYGKVRFAIANQLSHQKTSPIICWLVYTINKTFCRTETSNRDRL